MAAFDHNLAQQKEFDAHYVETRSYWFSPDPMTRYISFWRLAESIRRFRQYAGARFTNESSVLFLCAGDGAEASVCCDVLGFTNVTFSDISPVAVATGLRRDPRLKGVAADAENGGLGENSYDLVIVQDGLHHLRNPVKGFTEMLRIARVGAIFIEPHDALIGSLIGTKWERNGDAINFVFRWTKQLVEQVASSYLGPNSFTNLSFSYWHHNVVYSKLGSVVGQGRRGMRLVQATKFVFDRLLPGCGNMLSGIVVKAE